MADISLAEMNAAAASGAGDFLVNAANSARRGVCRAFKKAPAAFVGGPLDNPVAQAWDGLARRLCDPIGDTPDDASDPVPGGQCTDVLYDFTYRSRNTPSDPWIVSGTLSRYGPIRGIYLDRVSETAMAITLSSNGPTLPGTPTQEVLGFVSGDGALTGSAELLGVTRADGQPDNCGDVPPNYPQQPLQPSDLDFDDTLLAGGKPVKVPVSIKPVEVAVGIQVKPEFNINVGGIQVSLDITGAKINISPTFNYGVTLAPKFDLRDPRPAPVLPTPSPEQGQKDTLDGLKGIKDKLDEVGEDVQDAKECACDEEPSESLVPDLLGSGASGDFVVPERTRYVRLSISTQPTNPRRQNGLSAPDVLYAGWAWYKYLNGTGERLPIDAAEKAFVVPSEEEPSRFAFTCQTGFTAVATAYKLVET